MCMPQWVAHRGSGPDAKCRRLLSLVLIDRNRRVARSAAVLLGRGLCTTVGEHPSLDLPPSECRDPSLGRPAIRGAIPRVQVREHLVERHHAPRAIAFTAEHDVGPAANAERSMPGGIHSHAPARDRVAEHALEA